MTWSGVQDAASRASCAAENSPYFDAISDGLAGIDLRITVNNVFDEEYLGSIAVNSGAWIGAPGAVAAALAVDF